MKVLTIRTDKPEAELGLFDGGQQIEYLKWAAHRQLSSTIHNKIDDVLNKSSNRLENLDGIIVFKGPGSFTGLRIGISLANSLAYALDVPIVGADGKDWIDIGIQRLDSRENDKIVIPEYGLAANITQPKK